MMRLPLRRLLAGALGLGAACSKPAGSVAYDGPFAATVRREMPKLEQGTGLRFKRPPVLETRTRDQVRDFLEKEFTSSRQAKEIDLQGSAYRLLGLLPDTLDLRKLYLDLLTEQVAGYYDPKTKKLYVVDGQPEDMVGITVTHELVHALQDQYINLDSIATTDQPNDRQMAAQAVIEGQAMYEQFAAMMGEGSLASKLPGGWDMVRQQIRENSSSMPRFADAPFVVQEDLIFPYLSGAEYIRAWKNAKKNEAPYGLMPVSTEQVLHPEKRFGATPDQPIGVTLPAPRSGAVVYQNTLGEFETRLFLYQALQDAPIAARGAAGWGGDRYEVVRFATGEGIAWLTVWDTPVDAADFYQITDRAVIKRWAPKTYRKLGESGKLYANVGGRAVRLEAVQVQGKPAVLYVDVPASASTELLDLSKVRLTGN